MEYAIALYFDNNTERRIQAIMNSIVQNGCNSYMLDAKIPPHITIGFFDSDDGQKMIDVLDQKAGEFKSDKIIFSSVGMFMPSVL